MRLSSLRAFLMAAVLALTASCGGDKDAATTAPPANAIRVDESKAGTVAGRVTMEGAVPANPPISLDADPYCASQNPNGARIENFVVDNAGLENVFVYVKD